MRFAPIVPMSMMEEIRTADYHLVIAPMLRVHEYYEFYRDAKGFKILDNGAAEGKSVSPQDLLMWADAIQADEVVAPDVYGHMDGTVDLLRHFVHFADGWKIMAVMQSTTWPQFDYIFKTALHLNANTLALPRVMCEHMGPFARLVAAEMIRSASDIEVHALGCTRRLSEARDLARQGIVRGIDSSAPVVQGLFGQGLRGLYSSRPSDFFVKDPTQTARDNLDAFYRWCEHPEAPLSEL